MDGWRPYLTGMAHGVRRYARAHPHAFPLVATRPPAAPWVNPPLRSLRWVEAMLSGLAGEGFSDEQVLFTYRTFNGFLLGYLLLETSAMALRDPKPGDGSFTGTDTASDEGSEPGGATADPVPGGLSPARSAEQREAVEDAGSPRELIDPTDEIDARRFPTVHLLAAGLAQDRWDEEFETGLVHMLDRVATFVADGPNPGEIDGIAAAIARRRSPGLAAQHRRAALSVAGSRQPGDRRWRRMARCQPVDTAAARHASATWRGVDQAVRIGLAVPGGRAFRSRRSRAAKWTM